MDKPIAHRAADPPSTATRRRAWHTRPSWQRNLAILWVGELLAIGGFSVTLPFLPYYVQELGISGVKQVAFWAGLLTSAQATTMAFIAPVWGLLADRHGRKLMVERAMFGGAVILGAMGFVQNVYQLAVLRAIQGLLTGTVPAATALVASSAPPERRGYAMGMLQMAIYLGSSVGPWIGGLVADHMGYRATFWVTGSLLFLAGILVAIFVHEEFTPARRTEGRDGIRQEGQHGAPAHKAPLWEGLLLVVRTRVLMIVFGVRVLVRMGTQVVGPIMPLFIQGIAAAGTKIASVTGTITGVSSATSAVSAIVLGRASDRIGARYVLLGCSLVTGVLYVLIPGAHNPTQLLILQAIIGAAMGGILAAVNSLLAHLTPRDRFGAVYGVDTSLVATANAVSPMIGAALIATWGFPAAFFCAAATYLLGMVVVVTLVPAQRRGASARTQDE